MKTPLFMDRVLIFPFPSTKTALFMDGRLIFPFPSMKTPFFMDETHIFLLLSTKAAIFMDKKRQPKAVLSGRRELNYVKAVRIGI